MEVDDFVLILYVPVHVGMGLPGLNHYLTVEKIYPSHFL